MKIYEDSSRLVRANNQLFENKKYYIDFEATDDDVTAEIQKSKLSQFINWQKGNKFATLTITNFIGNIYFFGNTFDVKSQKFLTELTGTEQFKTILSDIQELSKNIIFTYSSPSFVLRQVDYKDANPSLLLMFNYFKKVILNWDYNTNLESSLHKIINNPNHKYDFFYEIDNIEKIKKVDNKTLRSLVSENKYYVKLNSDQSELISLPITKFVSQNLSDNYFPTKALLKKQYLSFDTPENRFVKFLFRYIEGIAYRLNSIRELPKNVIEEKELVLSFCRSTLNNPFFKKIGEMKKIPVHSTVLQGRSGYKDMFLHFTRSRFGIKHIFDEFEEEALSIDLKRISDIYEYWVFYKIAIAILGTEIIIEQQNVVLNNGEISYGVCFKNKTISVYYNWTESRARKTSYSVTLRPDTTVVIKNNGRSIKLIFDAKYKVRYKDTEEGLVRYVNPEDIYKMHTYLDAIDNCQFAMAVYPGSEFYFYERNLEYPIRRNISSIKDFHGVGALPLIPKDEKLDKQFNEFIDVIKKRFATVD